MTVRLHLVVFAACFVMVAASALDAPTPKRMRGGLMVSTAAPMGRRSTLPGLESTLAAQLQRPHVGVAPGHTPVVLHFALNHDDADKAAELDRRFWDANTPGSEQEGQYVSPSEMAELMAPHEDTLQALHAWLADEGVPSSSVHLSPWKDHLFVDTDVDTAQRLLQMPLHAYRHSSSDPEVVGKLVVAADSGELPASHPHASRVAIVRVAGSVDAASMGARSDAAESTTYPLYPFSFWPPSPVIAAEVTNSGDLFMELAVTCAAWEAMPYPFSEGPPDFLARAPCGRSYGEIESFDITVTDSSGSQQAATFEVSPLSGTSGCAVEDFAVYVCADDECVGDPIEELMAMAVCEFEVSAFDFEIGEAYTVSVTSNLEASSNGGSRPWVGYPSHDSLRVVQTQAKTPSLVHSFYGVPGSPVACETDNIQAIGVLQSTSSGFYSNDDLSTFYDHNDISTSEVGLVQFVGSIDPSSALQARLSELGLVLADDPVVNIQDEPGDETTLDVEWISATAPGALTQVYHGGYFLTNSLFGIDPMMSVVLAIQYASPPPLVLSMSYGGPELGNTTQSRVFEDSFKAMGALGVSVLASSGDAGAFRPTANAQATCQVPAVNYPASSPYVTGVGATQMGMVDGAETEIVASIETGSLITSGGGFSSQFPAPKWQQSALQQYAGNAPSHASKVTQRGVPDVSLWGHNYEIVLNGRLESVDGTSCSSPTFAGLITLMNDVRLRNGQPALGFLNPRLYGAWSNASSVFNDVTTGNNNCAGGNGGTGVCCTAGYSATTGWDPATGLGTPAFGQLSAMLLGEAYVSGTCTVESRDCAVTGHCVGPLAWWAILIICVGGVALIAACCCCVFRMRQKRYRALDTNVFEVSATANAYQAMPDANRGLKPVQSAPPSYVQSGAYQAPPPPAYAAASNAYGQSGMAASGTGMPVAQPATGTDSSATYGQPSSTYGQPTAYGAPSGAYGGSEYGQSTYGQPSGSAYPQSSYTYQASPYAYTAGDAK